MVDCSIIRCFPDDEYFYPNGIDSFGKRAVLVITLSLTVYDKFVKGSFEFDNINTNFYTKMSLGKLRSVVIL